MEKSFVTKLRIKSSDDSHDCNTFFLPQGTEIFKIPSSASKPQPVKGKISSTPTSSKLYTLKYLNDIIVTKDDTKGSDVKKEVIGKGVNNIVSSLPWYGCYEPFQTYHHIIIPFSLSLKKNEFQNCTNVNNSTTDSNFVSRRLQSLMKNDVTINTVSKKDLKKSTIETEEEKKEPILYNEIEIKDITVSPSCLVKNTSESYKQVCGETEEHNFVDKRVKRTFFCAHCEKAFDTNKLRNIHINEQHPMAQLLTIKSLFEKRRCSENEKWTCRLCNSSFLEHAQFSAHLDDVHKFSEKGRGSFCPTCLVHFPRVLYENHIRHKHPYKCPIFDCMRSFKTKYGFMMHRRLHLNFKPYKCKFCTKSFDSKKKLQEHSNVHSGQRPFRCAICNYRSKRLSNFSDHLKYTHYKMPRTQKQRACSICNKQIIGVKKYLWHQETHSDVPQQCPICLQKFLHVSSVNRHMRVTHNASISEDQIISKNSIRATGKTGYCNFCKKKFLKSSLVPHIRMHMDIKRFECEFCSKKFRTNWNLQNHIAHHKYVHNKPYKCRKCKNSYVSLRSLNIHIRSHNKRCPFVCNDCGQGAQYKYSQIRHVREHILEKQYKCSFCSKYFMRKYYLTEHMKVHTGLKPFMCEICSKKFSTKSNFNKHMRTHDRISNINILNI